MTEPHNLTRPAGTASEATLTPLASSAVASSKRLLDFLNQHQLHKKDFAEMIGVTLSYVYSLLDTSVSFSTRITTLERIAVVMDTQPETFAEYKLSDDLRIIDPGIQFLQTRQAQLGLNNVQFLRRFSRQQRIRLVDMWRGVLPLPLNWSELLAMALALELSKKDVYPFWEARMRQYLSDGGLDPIGNHTLTEALMNGAKTLVLPTTER
jgi:transcriptional regulator with XRE-family HTH domain